MSEHLFTEKNPRFFYDVKDFSYLDNLVKNTAVIREELLLLIKSGRQDEWVKTFPNYVKSDKQKAWQIFSFMFFTIRYVDNASICPQTAELIYSIPEILSCDFSYLKANTHVLPHKGYSKMVLRCHLPLIIPNEELCAIRVGDEVRHWKEGELMIFDDSFEHEAWNKSDEDRIVLMFDIPNPLWGYSAYEISKYKMENVDDPFLLSLTGKENWIKLFNHGRIPPLIPF